MITTISSAPHSPPQARENFLATLLTITSVIKPGTDNLAATSDAVASITATPTELNSNTQALAVRLLQGVAGAGASVTANVASTAALGLSNVADAVVIAATAMQPQPGGGGDGNGAPPSAPGSNTAPGQLLRDISSTVNTLASSLQTGMLALGEAPVAVQTPSIQFVAQLDSRENSSRLFAAPLTLPDGVTRFTLPPGMFGDVAVSHAGISQLAAPQSGFRTLLAAFAFNVHRPEDPLGLVPDGNGSTTSGTITRLRFTEGVARGTAASGGSAGAPVGAQDAEVKVEGLTRPITFTIPPAGNRAENAGSVCRFWVPGDPLSPGADSAGTFSTEGCTALPSPLPPGHVADWSFEEGGGMTTGTATAGAAAYQQQQPPPPPARRPPPAYGQAPRPPPSPPPPPPPSPPSPPSPSQPPPAGASRRVPPPPANPDECRAEDGADLYPALRGTMSRVLSRGQIGPYWELTGPLMCGCKSVLLDCKADAEAAAQAAERVLREGGTRGDAAEAAEAARTVVYPSASRALLVPAVRCKANDTVTVMRIYFGDKCRVRPPCCEFTG